MKKLLSEDDYKRYEKELALRIIKENSNFKRCKTSLCSIIQFDQEDTLPLSLEVFC
jgi:hypothetical protein